MEIGNRQLWRTSNDGKRKPRFSCSHSSILTISFFVTILSNIGAFQCTFVSGTDGMRENSKQTIGLFSIAVYEATSRDFLGCVDFPDTFDIDFVFRIGQISGGVMALASSIAFLLLIWNICFHPTGLGWGLTRSALALSSTSSLFTFSLLSSQHCTENDCSLTGVGILTLFTVFVMAGLTVMVYLEPPPQYPWFLLWTDADFVAGRDTLGVTTSESAEFMPSRGTESPQDDLQNIDHFVSVSLEDLHPNETEDIPAGHAMPNSSQSVASGQSSIQETLVSATSIQRSESFRFIMLGAIAFAWVCSILGIRNCSFIRMGPSMLDRRAFVGMGLYTRAFYVNGEIAGCLRYSETRKDEFDAMFQAGRIFGSIAALVMTAVMMCGIAQLFSNMAKVQLWYCMRALLPCALLAESLTLLVYGSNICTDSEIVECVPGGAGYLVLFNAAVMCGLAITTFSVPPPSNPVFVPWGASTFATKTVSTASCNSDCLTNKSYLYLDGSESLREFPTVLPPKDHTLSGIEEAGESQCGESECDENSIDTREIEETHMSSYFGQPHEVINHSDTNRKSAPQS